ncbi:hypothetical protein ACIQOU_28150 [Streptomyces sp. NPDC091279]|uniref:hypothetical protein n=1 Tax=Streptomyces sp. NPDC091279 TaxID=3365983 RepID=UPI0037FD229C
MTNQQPYEGSYNPYQQQPEQPQQAWPGAQQQGRQHEGQQGYQDAQQWQGQTWETRVQPPIPAADASETAYLPQQPPQAQQQYGVTGTPMPPENGHQAQPGHHARHGQQPQQGWQGSPAQTGPAHPAYQAQSPATPAHSPYGHQAPAPSPYADQHQAPGAPAHPAYADQHQAPGAAASSPYAGPGQAANSPYPGQGWQDAQQQQPPAPPAEATGAGAGADGDAGYGPATIAGNARVTDAQRARLEGRSPIIEPGMQPAALTALLGLLLAGSAAVGSWALLVPLVGLQGLTAAGWFRLNGMWPARQGIALAFLGALVADAALMVAGRSNAPAVILGTIGVWVLLTLVLQLRSHADPDERMYGLMATVTSAALAIMATGLLGAAPHAVSVGAAAVAVAVLARALPLPTPVSVVVALLAAAGAGIAVGGMTGLGAKGALLGAGAAGCALIGHRVASYDYPSRFVHFTAGVALPLTAAAPAVYVLGRALA